MITPRDLTNKDIKRHFRTFFSRDLEYLGGRKFRNLDSWSKEILILREDTALFHKPENERP